MSSSTSASTSAGSAPDVVYLVRPGENEELRYSLRSLSNVEGVGNVWLVGFRRRWVHNVQFLQTHQRGTKWASTTGNLLTALGCSDISDPFLLWNDDFFALRPVRYKTWDRGTLDSYLQRNRKDSKYRKMGVAALRQLHDEGFEHPLNFELHLPLAIHKQAMRDTIAAQPGQEFWKRTVYGNRARRDGLLWSSTRQDVKVATNDDCPLSERDWVSTTDRSFADYRVGAALRERFSEPGEYEK